MKRFKSFIVESLELTKITQAGHHFETGVPVKFPFRRNTISAKTHGLSKEQLKRFQSDIEPAGMYMIFDEIPDDDWIPTGWIKGEMEFQNPIVLRWNGYNESGWKAQLYRKYKKKGKALSDALKRDGYDGIVTVSGDYVSEIVKL